MFGKLREIILMYVEYDENAINENTEFLKDLGMSSFDIASLIGEVEEEFDIDVETEDLKDIITIKDLMDYISNKQQ